jgi:hypothetical protein
MFGLALFAVGCGVTGGTSARAPESIEIRLDATAVDDFPIVGARLLLPDGDDCSHEGEPVMYLDDLEMKFDWVDAHAPAEMCFTTQRFFIERSALPRTHGMHVFSYQIDGTSWEIVLDQPFLPRRALPAEDGPLEVTAGAPLSFEIPEGPVGMVAHGVIGPRAGASKQSLLLEGALEGGQLVLDVPEDTPPGTYTLFARADVAVPVRSCPFGACVAYAAARFFGPVTVTAP